MEPLVEDDYTGKCLGEILIDKGKLDTFVKIPEQKADNLVDMMGELLILQSLLKENIINGGEASSKGSDLNNVERMERILKDMQTKT